jgi:hypothetical protein
VKVTAVTTTLDGLRVHIIVEHAVAQTTKLLIRAMYKAASDAGFEPPTFADIQATWLDKAKIVCKSGRELVMECAWNAYHVQENIMLDKEHA